MNNTEHSRQPDIVTPEDVIFVASKGEDNGTMLHDAVRTSAVTREIDRIKRHMAILVGDLDKLKQSISGR